MSSLHRPRLRRLGRHRRRGQSIPIIALMILVLVAMVGLSVDVGNTFSHEREAVSATNAAAIAGMSTYLQSRSNANIREQDVYKAIEDSLKSNGLNPGDGSNDTVNVVAYYLDSQGNLLSGHPVIDPNNSNPVQDNVAYIQVSVDGKVDTSFARVVGRPDLPINATAHAGLCPADSGVYPLGVDGSTITGNEFNKDGTTGAAPEYQRLTTGKYSGYVQRRIYVKNGAAGSFSWLRWMQNTGAEGTNANSNIELTASMTGVGNLGSGFEEAAWPSEIQPKPAVYPEEKGTLNVGDWVSGSSGWNNSNSLGDALDEHIANETKMVLPIYSDIVGTGANVKVRVVNLGSFVLIGQGREPGNGPYFDMVYMGAPVRQYVACSVTPPPPADSSLELWGNVSFFPEYAIIPSLRQPIQYVVVMDASGSMSANFNGQCNQTGQTKQCANGPPDFPAVEVVNTGTTSYWKTESERRVYVAKNALTRLVSLTNMPGNAGYDSTRPTDTMAVVWFNDSVAGTNAKAFSSDPAAINSFILGANKTSNDIYRSQGGTNGAAGLYKASQLYAALGPNGKTTTFGGKDWEYKRVVLYISDGVSNVFLDTNAANLSGGGSSYKTYAKGTTCYNLGDKVVESAECQTTDKGGFYTAKSWDRPITQMVKTSTSYLRNQTVQAEVFVIALSNIPSTGLKDGVASSSSYFFSAESLVKNNDGTTNVDKIIDEINTKVEKGNCVPGADGANRGTIPSDQYINTGGSVPTYPQVGQVVIKSATDTRSAPILAGTDGTLTYRFTDVPRGTYTMRAYLYYHHPLDPPNVVRQYSEIFSGDQAQTNYTVDVMPSTQGTSFNQAVRKDVNLHLTGGNVCGGV